MTTELLYLNDSYLTECEASVLSCERTEAGYAVRLNRTVLFPTGGGQPHDTGYLNGIPVSDVIEDGEAPIHVTAAALTPGTVVKVKLDWPRRFDHMQQHSGEHILSFAAHALFSAVNVGFHMAADYSTVDFDRPLSGEEIEALEQRTNEYLAKNLPVEISYTTEEELGSLPLRKAAKGLTGAIRIVSMPGGDSCTCCATHVKALGEVGQLKITGAESWKGGVRLTFLCGMRALSHARRMQRIAEGIARSFSTAAEDAAEAVKRLRQEEQNLRRENKALWARLSGYLAEELWESAEEAKGIRLCVRLLPDLPPAQLKPLAQAFVKKGPALALLCAPLNGSLQYLLCCSESTGLDMGEAANAVNAALNGRGGGRGTLAQGSARETAGAEQALEQLARYFAQYVSHRKS